MLDLFCTQLWKYKYIMGATTVGLGHQMAWVFSPAILGDVFRDPSDVGSSQCHETCIEAMHHCVCSLSCRWDKILVHNPSQPFWWLVWWVAINPIILWDTQDFFFFFMLKFTHLDTFNPRSAVRCNTEWQNKGIMFVSYFLPAVSISKAHKSDKMPEISFSQNGK